MEATDTILVHGREEEGTVAAFCRLAQAISPAA